ncbi:MAG: response regulator, partial [Gammaproteobacteria bacterium]|nr:response regulator [Gammaproteobacteria bacterium]
MKETTVKVLVVDDEEDLELLIKQKFRRRIRSGELEFMFAHNGREGLLKLAQNRDIHLVFSDINMPVMDGLTMLHQLAEADLDVQAVIVSAYGDMGNIRTAMNRGAFDFLTKPIDFADLEITLEKGIAHVRELQASLETRDKLVSIKRELEVASQVQMSA